MKKFKYLIFSICLFFFMIFSANAKEVNFSGNTIEIDDTTYPYFFIINSTDSNFDYYVFLLTNDQKDDFFLNSKGTTTYNFQTKSGNSVRYCKYKGSTSTSCSNSWYIDIKTNEVHYLSNFDVKNKSGSIAFVKNLIENPGLGKFPVEINNIELSKFGKGTENYDKIYSNVLNFIKNHSDECKYYMFQGIHETYNDDNGRFDSIRLKCIDSSNTEFYACPLKLSDGNYVSIFSKNSNIKTYDFGLNNYMYDSSINNDSSFFSFISESNNLIFYGINEAYKNNYYFKTNIEKITLNCSKDYSFNKDKRYDSIIYKGIEYKVNNNDVITFDQYKPKVDYDLIKNNLGGYDVLLTYYNMSDKYYTNYKNLTLGTTVDINLDNSNTFKIEKLNYDTILTVYIYDLNNNIIDSKVIDLNNIQVDLKNDPYILIKGYNQNNQPNSVAYRYYNTKKSMKCYHQFGGQEKKEEDCTNSNIYLRYASYNTYLHLFIEEDGKIIYKKSVNLNFIEGMPQVKFNSYFDSIENVQKLNIILNYTDSETDTYYYSYDNENWTQFYETDMTLNFYNNTDFYVKIKRNNTDIADGYIYIIFNSYSNGNPNGTGSINNMNNIFTYFNSFGEISDQIIFLFSNTWNNLKNNQIITYFMILIIGTSLILIIKAINRK